MPKLLLTENHTQFLTENRQDPITGDSFLIGDEIVFCASCKSAFHVDSWDYMNGVHCGQNGTLQSFPVSKPLKLEKKTNTVFINNYYVSKNASLLRITAGLIDILVTTCALLVFSAFGKLVLLTIPFWIFRDAIFKHSLGKRAFNLYFIDKTEQAPIKRKVLALRAFIYWTANILPSMLFYQIESFGGFVILGLLNFIHFIFLLDGELPSIDTMLGIKLVRKFVQQPPN